VTVLIPRTASNRRERTYARLLRRVHQDRTMVNAFEGALMRPGSRVEYSALWPDNSYPENPVLLEFAGSDYSGRGHNRSNQIHVLWRFDMEQRVWIEITRTLSQDSNWIMNLIPIALREVGGPPPVDPALASDVSADLLCSLDAQLGNLSAIDRELVLNLVFEQLAARMVSAGP
jgi:hypothetical protein